MPESHTNCWYNEVCAKADNNPCTKFNTCPRFLEMQYLMEESGLPKSKQWPIKIDLYDDCDEIAYERLAEIKDDIVDFVNSGKNLLIASKETGNGKTSWAIKLLHKYFDQVWSGNGFKVRGLFVHVPTLLMQLKDFSNPNLSKIRQRIIEADLVVWDDIACLDVSKYDYENLLIFLDNRILAEKSNIFTSNKSTEELFIQYVGQRLTSRVWSTSEIIILNGEDKRGRL